MDDSSREVEVLLGETEGFALAQPEADAEVDRYPVALVKRRAYLVDDFP
ncbi:hypothetical protein ACFFKE_17600 [Streptomyces mutabilis]|nr:hypothetical protein [Streptomyces mutabilis]